MKNFEYKTLIIHRGDLNGFAGCRFRAGDLDHDLNEMGALGWELVNVVPYGSENGISNLICFFKREKETN